MRRGRCLRRLDAANDDVGRSQFQNLLLSLLTGPFANRQHRDHGEDSEHNSKHRQPRPQFVQHQAFECELNGSK